MEELVNFSQKVREWKKYLEASTDINNPNWVWAEEPSPLPFEVKSGMVNEDSTLFLGIGGKMFEKGVDSVLRHIVATYFGGFISLVERCNDEMMDEYPALREMALVGGTFLQLLADKAYSYGMDAGGILSITRRMPRGAGGVDHPKRYSLGGHTQGTAIHCSSDEFLCNPQEQQKWPQEAANGNGLTTTPNKSKQAAEGQQIGNNEPKQEMALQDLLPKQLWSVEAAAIFQRAIDDGLIEKSSKGLKWLESNALLAYMCGKIYCGDTMKLHEVTKEYVVQHGSDLFPEQALNDLFRLKNLGQSRYQILEKRPPGGFEKVDMLFDKGC